MHFFLFLLRLSIFNIAVRFLSYLGLFVSVTHTLAAPPVCGSVSRERRRKAMPTAT